LALAELPAAPAWENWGSASAHLPAAAALGGAHSRVPAVRDEVHSVSAEVRAAERFLALAAQDGVCLPDAIQSRDERFHAADSTRAQLARESASSHGFQPGDSMFPDGSRSRAESRFPGGLRLPGESPSPDGSRLQVGLRSPVGSRFPDGSPSLAGLKWPGDSRFLCYSALLPVLLVEPSLLDFPPEQ